MKDIYDRIVRELERFFEDVEFSKAIVGLSGGIDSAVVAALTCQAIGNKNVTGVHLPSDITELNDRIDTIGLADNLRMRFRLMHINPSVVSILNEVMPEREKTAMNVQARVRAVILMGLSNEEDALVVNTGNKSEGMVGYCTLYGDTVGAVAPIGDLLKRDVYKLAEYINRDKEIIPSNIMNKAPSAGLHPDQTDEKELGLSYEELDAMLSGEVEWSDHLSNLYMNSEFKRVRLPIVISSREYE